ncbi:MAG TPA: hypothetical protein P5079_01395, partial [Elusimicrobiota bacterium]|nr:hypothetical protein [Elusimicrobiota bacterium]
MAKLDKKLLAAQALSARPRPAAKPTDPVLVIVPHVPVPDRIPEDRAADNLIKLLREHFRVVIAADRPAPLEDPYRRHFLMEGIEIVGGQQDFPQEQP